MGRKNSPSAKKELVTLITNYEEFGKRDHTTVMHGCNKIEKEIKENTNTKLIVESVKKIILEKK